MDMPAPVALAVQGLLALTCTVWTPPSAEKARFSGETVRTGSGVVLHPKTNNADAPSRKERRRFIFIGDCQRQV
jgi:hypothetical protein